MSWSLVVLPKTLINYPVISRLSIVINAIVGIMVSNNISFPFITGKLCMYVDKNGWARNGNMCHLKIILNERSIYSNMYLFKRGGGKQICSWRMVPSFFRWYLIFCHLNYLLKRFYPLLQFFQSSKLFLGTSVQVC